ncbi:MAG: hypothetical protein LC778_19220 [Acidobacteria bacterium]|nr:hypothetical protein [Acidobacteriota bacterium]
MRKRRFDNILTYHTIAALVFPLRASSLCQTCHWSGTLKAASAQLGRFCGMGTFDG